jgi:DUF4097 and DUF4098 domain-containing protein YvlB
MRSGHRLSPLTFLLLAGVVAVATPAAAQRVRFERAIDVMPGATLDVTTVRGKVDVTADDGRQIRVMGTVTVRAGVGGINIPDNAPELAKRVADHPRIDVERNTVRLRPPTAPDELRAVTVSYEVRVPRDTHVIAVSDSGAISIDEVSAPVAVTTQSSAIALGRITGKTDVKTGSGAVNVDRADGGLRVVTQSSAITVRGHRGLIDARTQSGAVRASFAGPGGADVETGSSAVTLEGVSGPVTVRSQSGRVELRGNPSDAWHVTTGSSVVDVALESNARVNLDATSSSGSVRLDGFSVVGSTAKGRVSGTVGGGGPTVRLASRSGSIRIGR